jgi:hypothetical protein
MATSVDSTGAKALAAVDTSTSESLAMVNTCE